MKNYVLIDFGVLIRMFQSTQFHAYFYWSRPMNENNKVFAKNSSSCASVHILLRNYSAAQKAVFDNSAVVFMSFFRVWKYNWLGWPSALNVCFSHYHWYEQKRYNWSGRKDYNSSNILCAACYLQCGASSFSLSIRRNF